MSGIPETGHAECALRQIAWRNASAVCSAGGEPTNTT